MAVEKSISKTLRLVAMGVLVCGAFAWSATRLMSYQIVAGEDYLEEATTTSTSTYTVTAARGDIVDRYGRVLATSESVYNIVFNYSFTKTAELNDTLYRLIELMREQGLEWNNSTPIEQTDTGYEFMENQETAISNMLSTIRQASYSSADDCIDKMYSRYSIDTKEKINSVPIEYTSSGYAFTEDEDDILDFKDEYGLDENLSATQCINQLEEDGSVVFYSEEDAFEIATIRYSMEKMLFSVDNQYVFAEDIDNETIIKIKELSYLLTGVSVENEPARVYVNGEVATHLLGTVGPIYAEENETYKELGYPMDAVVGKSGIELTFESELRGVDGESKVIQSSSGDIIEEYVITEAQKGNTVQLTIDAVFQEKIQEILSEFVATASTNEGQYASTGGAVVVLDIATGESLAIVTEPTYSVETYKTSYSELLETDVEDSMLKENPLLNKALNGQYRPGSTFKPVMAVAGLQEGAITPTSTLYCTSPFVYYETPYGCLQDSHSGSITVTEALKWSCNTFFYQLGDMLGLDTFNGYAESLGLGVDTGLEIYQEDGKLTQYTDDGTWYIGKIVQAAIGQADTYVTPIQMAVEAMTIANQGVRYETHIIDQIIDVNDEVVFETEPVIASVLEMSDSTYETVYEGMRQVGSKLTGDYSLMGFGYDVCVKTGTAQTVNDDVTNNAFIAFTPEIAISCMVENCDTGTNKLIKSIIEAYEECKLLGEAVSNVQYPQSLDDITYVELAE